MSPAVLDTGASQLNLKSTPTQRMDPNLGFNSPALGGGATSKLSRPPRFVKMRKQQKNTTTTTTQMGGARNSDHSGFFNPFRTGTGLSTGVGSSNNSKTDTFTSGVSSFDAVKVLDEMRNLKIDGNKKFDFAHDFNSGLPDELKKKLNITKNDNVSAAAGSELSEEMKKKLNIGNVDVDGSFLKESLVCENLKNMDIKDSATKTNNLEVEGGKVGNVESSFGGKHVSTGTENVGGTGFGSRPLGFVFGEKMQSENVMASSQSMEFAFGEEMQRGNVGTSSSLHTEFAFGEKMQSENVASSSSSLFGTSGVGTLFGGYPTDGKGENKVEFSFASRLDGMGVANMEFKMPSVNKKVELGKDTSTKLKKKKGKLRKPIQLKTFEQDAVLRENVESSEAYSPMDVSPYRETLADGNACSRETSVASDEPVYLDDSFAAASELHEGVGNDALDEELAAAAEHLDIDETDVKSEEVEGEQSAYCCDNRVILEGPSEDYISGAETESFQSATDQLDYGSDTFVTAAETEVTSGATLERHDSGGVNQFSSVPNIEEIGQSGFVFAASSGAQSHSAAVPRQSKKKNRTKIGHESYSSTSSVEGSHGSSHYQFFPVSGASLLSPRSEKKSDMSKMLSEGKVKYEPLKKQEVNNEVASTTAVSTAAQEACEKWRLRGNQAYSSGDLFKAEDCYTQGVNCVSQSETSRSCLQALMLCYSNRAATRMSLGRMREALGDCMKAATLDPNFLRVQVRAANCYLALGEFEKASLHFMKCLQAGTDIWVDRKLLVEASEGIQKAQKLSECMKESAARLERRTAADAEDALVLIAEAMAISSYSEKLFEMKADALFLLRRYEDVIQLCEKTLDYAESNNLSSYTDCQSENVDSHDLLRSSFVRRCSLVTRSYFYLGRLDEAIDFLKKQEEAMFRSEGTRNKTLGSIVPLFGTIQDLLRHKTAGNEAYQSGRHGEAVEHYTAAISCSVESRPFAAICFCNRAAAYRSMGQITDAIADCSLAIALDGNYVKAISRRATLFEMIRDYGQAAADLQKLVSLLTKKVEDKIYQSGQSDKMSSVNELRQAQVKLSAMEEESRKEIPLNMYLILGIEPAATASDIRKAYRKAALRHHPDKSAQSLARSENGDDGLWKEIAKEVHRDADRLFKMIGEAYAVLSDPAKRSQYDLEEEARNGSNRGSGSSTSRFQRDSQYYASERSGGRHQWQEVWRSYGNPQSKTSRSNWYS